MKKVYAIILMLLIATPMFSVSAAHVVAVQNATRHHGKSHTHSGKSEFVREYYVGEKVIKVNENYWLADTYESEYQYSECKHTFTEVSKQTVKRAATKSEITKYKFVSTLWIVGVVALFIFFIVLFIVVILYVEG